MKIIITINDFKVELIDDTNLPLSNYFNDIEMLLTSVVTEYNRLTN